MMGCLGFEGKRQTQTPTAVTPGRGLVFPGPSQTSRSRLQPSSRASPLPAVLTGRPGLALVCVLTGHRLVQRPGPAQGEAVPGAAEGAAAGRAAGWAAPRAGSVPAAASGQRWIHTAAWGACPHASRDQAAHGNSHASLPLHSLTWCRLPSPACPARLPREKAPPRHVFSLSRSRRRAVTGTGFAVTQFTRPRVRIIVDLPLQRLLLA